MHTRLTVSPGERPKRLDLYLLSHERDVSRSRLQRLIQLGRVRVNGRVAKPSQRVHGGDQIALEEPPPSQLNRTGTPEPLMVLYEDDAYLVIEKPAGVAMHPGSGHWTGTILNAVLHHFEASGQGLMRWPGLVHRLDKDTSGLVVIAKTPAAHRSLSAQFAQHTITRTYHAIVMGVPDATRAVIEVAIGRDRRNPMRISPDSARLRRASTRLELIEQYGNTSSLLRLSPQTGRTHQLRVHLGAMGHPIVGDPLYASPEQRAVEKRAGTRLMLHASGLGFLHTETGSQRSFESALPPEMQALMERLGATEHGSSVTSAGPESGGGGGRWRGEPTGPLGGEAEFTLEGCIAPCDVLD